MKDIYTISGKEFHWNQLVVMEMLMGVPDHLRQGRLVQVRKGVGQFGSDQYIIRLANGSLKTFENVLMRSANDKRFEHAFYISNGKQPPKIIEFENTIDKPEGCYDIKGEWLEHGFIIEHPKQPKTGAAVAFIVTQA